MAGDPGFLAALDDLRTLHLQKAHDYADHTDPLKNYVQSGRDSGIEPWRAAFTRLSEKYHRLVNLLNKGEEPNFESLEDSFKDLASMALIVRSLRAREPKAGEKLPDLGAAFRAHLSKNPPIVHKSPRICPCAQGDGDTGESAVGGEPV